MSTIDIASISPNLGRRVLYVLNTADCTSIVQRRRQAGLGTFAANDPRPGDIYPAIITRDFGVYGPALEQRVEEVTQRWGERILGKSRSVDSKPSEVEIAQYREALWTQLSQTQASTNLQVFLDGNDTYWATSRSEFDDTKHGRWVQVIDGHDAELPQTLNPEDYMDEGIEFRADAEGHWIALS